MDMSNLTLITMAWELHQEGIATSRIAARLGKQRETIHLWLRAIGAEGLLPFLERYRNAKKGLALNARSTPS
jgi:transposase